MADLNEFITKQEFIDAWNNTDLAKLVNSGKIQQMLDLEQTFLFSLSDYVKKSDLPDFSKFALKSDIPSSPDLSNCATKTDLQNVVTDVKQLTTMKSPDGSTWLLSINDDGNIATYKVTTKEQ
ncbi:hypothetical protein H7198_06850 [Fructobacillus sp. CRL 2054]|uniref:hypothetical protein n=1 Tax=Fructobacillus sp. CRL 2054 TaxID=2763007 RepID=UPI0023799540|nr:hypothetical protein [Fructobacillus sp. CRL 2054]MDD9139302.1 hypothetical protein [Fructobacillus sp. CRL 2054]